MLLLFANVVAIVVGCLQLWGGGFVVINQLIHSPSRCLGLLLTQIETKGLLR